MFEGSGYSSPRAFPTALRMRWMDDTSRLVVVRFSLASLESLSPAELAVARLAARDCSNASIAQARGTSPHTVARQMASVLNKLRIGSRLGLATIPELGA
jgi:DNA-binding CsgD family transcriptional regulator